ncbi:MAG: asparagine synthase (glutamine-hydrolyzing) [Pyrinomonadaceae bacterium]
MCGIAGYISKTTDRKEECASRLEAMCRVITHRGPDEQGIAIEGRAAMGMRRLSIIDLATGQQPIYNENRTKLIVFNGEIYNYRELKKDLESRGYKFRTNSDTETIIHAYDEFGEDCLWRLRGMFAFAIWDEREQSLFLARDRVGKKPLFYTITAEGEFVFGSELKVLLEHGGVTREIDHGALDAYLTFGYVPEELCIFKGVHKLEPGHFLIFKNGQIRIEKYWDFDFSGDMLTDSEEKIADDLLDRLRDAVETRLISEVPLGAFLSGGVDSSAVVGLMSQALTQPVKTFSIGFNEDSFDELKYARLAADHFKTDHHEFILTPDFVDIVDDLVWHFDEPFADSSALPTYMVSKLAREHVTVVLSGDGGDELFGGYTRYVTDRERIGLESLPLALRQKLIRPLSEALPHGTLGKNYLFNISLGAASRYIDSISHFNGPRKRKLYSSETRSKMNGSFERGEKLFRQIAGSVPSEEPLEHLLYLDSKTYLPSDILTKVDRMSMASSLETRSPLLDHKLIEYVTRIPSAMKLKGRETKYIFKKAVRDFVPAEILHREKQGFGVPINEWINLQLKERITNDLADRRSRERGYFDAKYINLLLDEHRRGRRDHSHALWTLWMLELWHRRYIDSSSI